MCMYTYIFLCNSNVSNIFCLMYDINNRRKMYTFSQMTMTRLYVDYLRQMLLMISVDIYVN